MRPLTSGATLSHTNLMAAANTSVEAGLIGTAKNAAMASVRSR
jgi:hypothetical protein